MGGIWPIIKADTALNLQERTVPVVHSDALEKFGLWLFHWLADANWGKADKSKAICFREINFFCISHLIHGDGIYVDRESQLTVTLKPGDLVINTPDRPFYLGACKKVYHEDFISFCGPIADNLLASGLLKDGVYSFGSARRLLPIINKLSLPTFHNQVSAGIELLALLSDIHFGKYSRKHSENFDIIGALLEEIGKDCKREWSVESMASFCSLSINYFRKLFKNSTGTLPKNYLDSLRMNEAALLLINSSTNLADLAKKYHYSDAFHFSRSFKRVMGISPAEFRKNQQS